MPTTSARSLLALTMTSAIVVLLTMTRSCAATPANATAFVSPLTVRAVADGAAAGSAAKRGSDAAVPLRSACRGATCWRSGRWSHCRSWCTARCAAGPGPGGEGLETARAAPR
eukprot:scaffold1216_cov357-Prasinococcus_capsulatus_cf.AAC.14